MQLSLVGINAYGSFLGAAVFFVLDSRALVLASVSLYDSVIQEVWRFEEIASLKYL